MRLVATDLWGSAVPTITRPRRLLGHRRTALLLGALGAALLTSTLSGCTARVLVSDAGPAAAPEPTLTAAGEYYLDTICPRNGATYAFDAVRASDDLSVLHRAATARRSPRNAPRPGSAPSTRPRRRLRARHRAARGLPRPGHRHLQGHRGTRPVWRMPGACPIPATPSWRSGLRRPPGDRPHDRNRRGRRLHRAYGGAAMPHRRAPRPRAGRGPSVCILTAGGLELRAIAATAPDVAAGARPVARRSLSIAVLIAAGLTTAAAALGPMYARAAAESDAPWTSCSAPHRQTGCTHHSPPPDGHRAAAGEVATGAVAEALERVPTTAGHRARWTGRSRIRRRATRSAVPAVWRDGRVRSISSDAAAGAPSGPGRRSSRPAP